MAWVFWLKFGRHGVDSPKVHFERLIIEAGEATFSLDLHRRMTVIAGVGPLEREGLVNELVGGLSSGRSGVHLELTSDAGTRYAIFRPTNGPHRVVDIDIELDVTSAFTGEDGRVNVLERAGLTVRSARQAMRMNEDALTTRSRMEEQILQLAHVDPARLWDVAQKVKDREAQLGEAADELGSDPDDASVLQAIEQRHAEFEEAQERHERARRVTMLTGINVTVFALLAAMLFGTVFAIPFLIAAVGLTVYSAHFWSQMTRARRHEDEALSEVGAESYLTFQIHRVNGLLSDDHQRKEMMRIAEYHRAALAEWHLLAGDIPVDWALDHRTEVRQAAARLRDTVGVRNPMALTMSPTEETEADYAHALLHRLTELYTLGAGGESFPLLLDEPFVDAPTTAKTGLLELLLRSSERQQVIFLTEDEDVAAWARTAAARDQLGLVEPSGTRSNGRTTGDDDRRRRRHVAA